MENGDEETYRGKKNELAHQRWEKRDVQKKEWMKKF